MASANQIRIKTGIDTSAINKELANLRKMMESIVSNSAKKELENFTKLYESNLKKIDESIDETTKKLSEALEKRKDPFLWKAERGRLDSDIKKYQNELRILQEKRANEVANGEANINALGLDAKDEEDKLRIYQEQANSLEEQRAILSALQSEDKKTELKDTFLTPEEYQANISMLEEMIEKDTERYGTESGIVQELQKELDYQQYLLGACQEETDTELEKQEVTKKTTEHIKHQNNALKKGISRIKQMALGLLGARTAYTAIRKIIGEVTDDNKQLANTIQGFWGSLGALFSPIINFVIQGLANILNYAMAIIRVLTGVNMLAKANSSIAKKNGAKGDNLASFDKSEVLKKDNGSGGNESFLKNIELSERLKSILEKIKAIWEKIKEIANIFFEQIKAPIQWIYDNLIVPLQDSFGVLLDRILEKLDEFGNWLSEHPEFTEMVTLMGVLIGSILTLTKVIPVLVAILNSPIAIISAIIVLVVALIARFGNMNDIIQDMKGILKGLTDFISGVFTGDWEKAWGGIVDIFKNLWNGIIDIVQSVLNGVVYGVNKVIDAMNTLRWDIPDWVPVIGGKTFGFSIGHINEADLSRFKFDVPKLAQGGVLQPNKPFMAMLGDQRYGRNIEAPEDLIRQIVAEESGKNITINADGDVGQLIRFLRFEISKEDSRVGTQLVI